MSLNVNHTIMDADAHRQRIVNWINAAGGTSSAFDVTTKVSCRELIPYCVSEMLILMIVTPCPAVLTKSLSLLCPI